jgi:uncharacterized membrane protein
MLKKHSTLLLAIALILLSIPSIMGIIHSGLFVSDDGSWMVVRFSAFYEALRNGQFPVRFLSRLNNGYGYPVANFLYPLFMYLGVSIHVLGFNFVNTIKIIFGLSLISSFVFSFLWLRKKFDNISSLIGSLVYLYFPYHLWDVYKRGSIGEVLALAIVPFVLWQIERKSFFFVSIGIAALILAHNTLALFFLPVILIYMFLARVSIKKIILSLVTALSLSAFFWIPALYDSQFTVFSQTSISDFSKYFTDYSLFGLIDFGILVSSIITFFLKKDKMYVYFFLLFIIFAFFTTSYSLVLWNMLPLTGVIQFPFRLLSIVCLSSAFLVSFQISLFKKRQKIYVSIIFLILLLISSFPFFLQNMYQYYPDSYYSTNVGTTTVKNEYMPKWVKQIPTVNSLRKANIVKGKGEISNLTSNGNVVIFSVNAKEKSLIAINTVYYPGWVVKIDGKNAQINYENESGVIQFNVDKGNHLVKANFQETRLRLTSDILSVVVFIALICLSIKRKPKKSI